MGVLTDAGRAAMVRAIKEQSMFIALGTGREEWGDSPPFESSAALELTNEVGRRAIARSMYVIPDDENGTLEVPITTTVTAEGPVEVGTRKFSVSSEPTRYLYVEFQLDFADAAGAYIRELGIFIGAKLKPDLPPGKMFFKKEDFEDEGLLFQLEHREPMLRKPDTRDTFIWVISI